jgi:hypothetical protein
MFDRKDWLTFKESARPPLNEEGYYSGNMGANPRPKPPLSDEGYYQGNMGADPKSPRDSQKQKWYEAGKSFADTGATPEEAEAMAAQILETGQGGMVAHDSFLSGFGLYGGSDYDDLADEMDMGGPSRREDPDVDYSGIEELPMSERMDRFSILSFDHNTWTGYVNSQNDRPDDDDFTKRLKDIMRG